MLGKDYAIVVYDHGGPRARRFTDGRAGVLSPGADQGNHARKR